VARSTASQPGRHPRTLEAADPATYAHSTSQEPAQEAPITGLSALPDRYVPTHIRWKRKRYGDDQHDHDNA